MPESHQYNESEAAKRALVEKFFVRMMTDEVEECQFIIDSVTRKFGSLGLIEKGIEIRTMIMDYLASVDYDDRKATIWGFTEWLAQWKKRMNDELNSPELQTALSYQNILPSKDEMDAKAQELMNVDLLREEMAKRKSGGKKP